MKTIKSFTIFIFLLFLSTQLLATNVTVPIHINWTGRGFLCLWKGTTCKVDITINIPIKFITAKKEVNVPVTFAAPSNEAAENKAQTAEKVDLSWKNGTAVEGKDDKGNVYIISFGKDKGKLDPKTKIVSLTISSIILKTTTPVIIQKQPAIEKQNEQKGKEVIIKK
jgi:hypothetical protein